VWDFEMMHILTENYIDVVCDTLEQSRHKADTARFMLFSIRPTQDTRSRFQRIL
jgi:hypothetical protein